MTLTGTGVTYRFSMNGKWYCYTGADLAALRVVRREQIMRAYLCFCKNRFSFFLPHCDGAAFINDRENDINILTKGNQQGGTSHGAAWVLARFLKCDPEWQIFTKHGVKYVPFMGEGRRVLIATSSWETMADAVWPEYQKLIPREELGVYAPGYGDPDLWPEEAATGKSGKDLMFKDGRTKKLTLLKSKTILVFSTYTQRQSAFESRQYDGGHLDEQMVEAQFDGFDERGRTRPGWQCCMTLTGHRIKGRPDTGAGQWIHRKLWQGIDTKGHTVGRYKLWIDGVPDVLYPVENKKKAYEKWVEGPKASGDLKATREGEARYFGGWESGGGLALDNWNTDLHVVPEFKVPKDWSRYRGLDHGQVYPTACLWCAVAPWGDMVAYREYYVTGKVVAVHCKNIVEASGNLRVKDSESTDEVTGAVWPVYEEVFRDEEYEASVLDGRSFKSAANAREGTLGQLYNDCGLYCTPANMQLVESLLPRMKEWLEYQPDRPHLVHTLWTKGLIDDGAYKRWLSGRAGQWKGGSRFYVMVGLRNFQDEAGSWQMMSDSERPMAERDHLMACFRYVVATSPCYFGQKWDEEEDNDTGTKWTGYG
jgi:hypothetical protein